ncbi:MAG: hypothetical protein ABH889_00235 [Candidatus Portnoybacteria bacterium]
MSDNDLEKLKKKIYRPGNEVEFEERLEGPETFDPEERRERVETGEWQKIKRRELTPEQKRKIRIAGIWVLAAFLIVSGFFFWRGLTSFDKDKVKLEIEGSERMVSGDEVKYVVKYKNETKLALNNLELVFRYPEDSIPSDSNDLVRSFSLGSLAVGEEKEIELPVRVIGLKEEKKKAWAELFYTPGNLSSRFSNKAEFETEIISVPFILDFDLPEKLVDGQSFSFSLIYSNQSDASFDDLRIEIEYPAGFVFESAQPSPYQEDNLWLINQLMAGDQGKIFIKGSLSGLEKEDKLFKAKLGVSKNEEFIPYAQITGASQISVSPLLINQTINQSSEYIARVGEVLEYLISYKNTTDIGVGDVVITSKLEGQILDLTSLETDPGSYDGSAQTITWNTSNLSDLEYLGPQEGGEIKFYITLKNTPPISNYSDKNFKVTNTLKINSGKVPLSLERIDISGESKSVVRVITDLTFQSQGFYNDDLIPNSGPIPPRVGQKTTYTIKWRVVNKNNDVGDARVEAYLPPHVKWEGKTSPANANLIHTPSTGQVVWDIGNLPAATGVLSPVKQVAFQVSITPSLANLGERVELIGQSKITGQDVFTGTHLDSITDSIDTDLPDDTSIGSSKSAVVE